MELNNLPTELCKLISSFFTTDTKLVVRVINNKWFNVIDKRDFVTFMVSKHQIEAVVDTFSRCSKPTYLSFKKNKFRKIQDLSKHITRLNNLTGLEIELIREKSEVSDWMALAVLTDLQYLRVNQNNDEIPSNLYGLLNGLTSLEDFSPEVADLDVLQNLTKLQRLEINLQTEFNPFNVISNPSILTSLITFESKFKFIPQDVNPYVNLKDLQYDEVESTQRFPVGILTRLESLCINAQDIDEYPVNLTSLTVQKVSPCHLTKLTKLEYLSVSINQSWNEVEKRELLSYIKSSNLTELAIDFNVLDGETGSNYFLELSGFTKLEQLSLHIADPAGQFDSAALSQAINSLTNLTQINVGQMKTNASPIIIATTLTKLAKIVANGSKILLEDASKMNLLREVSPGSILKASKNAEFLTNLENVGVLMDYPETIELLTKYQNLTSLSVLSPTTDMYNVIGQLTKLEHLRVPVKSYLNMETWTNLEKLTFLDVDIHEPTPMDKLTLLTSLQLLEVSIDSETEYQLDEQSLYEKLPNLYDIYTMYY